MVTKQQQLEWLAKNLEKWNSGYDFAVVEEDYNGRLYVRWPAVCSSGITKKEWQQERDKMSSKPDNSWYERGELPPVGCECRFFSDGYDENWFDWCIFHGLATCGGLIVEHHHKTSPSRVTVCLLNPRTTKFRPLCTDREKAIDEMILAIDHIKEGNFETFIGALYDAGYRKVKP